VRLFDRLCGVDDIQLELADALTLISLNIKRVRRAKCSKASLCPVVERCRTCRGKVYLMDTSSLTVGYVWMCLYGYTWRTDHG